MNMKQNTTEREHISIVLKLSEMSADDLKHFRDYCADHNADASALAFIDTAIRIRNASAERGN